MARGVGGRDRGAIGSARLGVCVPRLLGRRRIRSLAVKCLELPEVHALDIAADAAFGEAKRHPWLESSDRARLHAGVLIQVKVESVGPGVHEVLEPGGTLRV